MAGTKFISRTVRLVYIADTAALLINMKMFCSVVVWILNNAVGKATWLEL